MYNNEKERSTSCSIYIVGGRIEIRNPLEALASLSLLGCAVLLRDRIGICAIIRCANLARTNWARRDVDTLSGGYIERLNVSALLLVWNVVYNVDEQPYAARSTIGGSPVKLTFPVRTDIPTITSAFAFNPDSNHCSPSTPPH